MAVVLYLLLCKLLTCEPINGIDARYLILSHHPIINLLKNIFDINLYNDKFYSLIILLFHLNLITITIASLAHSRISYYSLMQGLHFDTGTILQSTTAICFPLSSCTLIFSCMKTFSLFNMF